MLGSYRAVAKLRAYLLHSVGSAAREKTCRRWWQFPSRLVRAEQAHDAGETLSLPRFSFHAHVLWSGAVVVLSFSGAVFPIHPGSFDEANVTRGGYRDA